jgi:hypothetical protein
MNKFHGRMASVICLDRIFLVVLALISTYLLIGDLGVRLANTSTDDGLVSYSYYFKFPERFAQDANLRNWAPAGLASMLNWLPAVLFKYAGIDPEIFYGLFAFLQNVLLALAMHRLAMVMTGSREAALISAVFTLAFRPHWWNMGLFADLDWMPYGAWMALPFLVFAGANALERRLGMTVGMLLVGGLIHPILGLFAGAMFGTYWFLLTLRERNLRELLRASLVLGLTGVAFMLPVIHARWGVEEAVAHLLGLVLRNGHAIPWANPGCSYCMPLFVKSLLLVPVMAILALVASKHVSMHKRLPLFLLGVVAVASAAFLLHVAAYFAHNATLLRVVGTRSTILLLIFAVPPVIAYACVTLTEANPFKRLLAALFIILPTIATGLSFLLARPRASGGGAGTGIGKWVAGACYVASAAIFALIVAGAVPRVREFVDLHVIEPVMGPGYKSLLFAYLSWGYKLPVLAVATAAVVCAALVWQSRRSSEKSVLAVLAGKGISLMAVFLMTVITVYLLVTNHKTGQAATSGEAHEYYKVQAWARTSTAVDAKFIVADTSVYEGWRNYTHRARISPGGCGFYICSKIGLEQAGKVSEFFAQHGNAGYAGLDTAGLKAFSKTFGGDYVVRRKAWKPVDLPVVFENTAYVVYDLR